MYFRKSVDIAKAHKALAAYIEDIDSIIYAHGDHPLRADVLADQLGIDEPLLLRILQLYASETDQSRIASSSLRQSTAAAAWTIAIDAWC